MMPFDKKIYNPAYKEAVDRAKQNLKGEELEKCLEALNNFMRNFVNE